MNLSDGMRWVYEISVYTTCKAMAEDSVFCARRHAIHGAAEHSPSLKVVL